MTTTPGNLAEAAATASATKACAHCGLPADIHAAGRPEWFCCHGCEAAYDAIRACGLDDYYALRERLDPNSEPARSGPGRYAELDDPAFATRHVTNAPGGLCGAELYIEGVHCAACVWLLEKLPTVVPGLIRVELDLPRRTARVEWDPTRVQLSEVAKAFDRFGYVPHPVEPSAQRDARRGEDRASMIRIGVAAACAGNVMLLAFALYSGEFSTIGEPYLSLFRWLSAAIGLLSVLWPGRVFYKGALAALRAGAWHLDTPIALALTVGSAAGVVAVARGSGEIYFDSITMLILLLLIGRWVQLRQQRRAMDSIEMLFSVTPRRVTLIRDGVAEEAAIDAVNPGDLVEVAPHACVPVDGLVESGSSSVDNSVLSGESRPLPVAVGDPVAAGAINLGSTIRVRVETAGRETRVGRLMDDIERLSRSRTPIIGSSDRLARPFVIAVLGAAALCLLFRLQFGTEDAIASAVALLIVCCPCAIALATPMATSIAIGRLARRGILVKGGDTFEPLAGSPAVVLDKTGTLTEGRFTLRGWAGDESLKPVAAGLEADSTHPIGRTLARVKHPAHVEDIDHALGAGVSGTFEGDPVAAGSGALMRTLGIDPEPWAQDAARDASLQGLTAVYIARDGRVGAVAALGDAVRADAAESLNRLRARGWKPEIRSGDREETVAAVAGALGIEDHHGGESPESKRLRVKQLRETGDVVMVGDGVNDATALAEATVGVSVSGGAEASLAAAGVYLSEPGLKPLADLADASRSVTFRIRLCLRVALCYNLAAAGLAFAGLITPLLAAVLMPVSSLTVLSIALGSAKSATTRPKVESAP